MLKRKKDDKLYVVRKYIFAKSAKEAIRRDKTHPVDDVWVDDRNLDNLYPREPMGFASNAGNKK